MFNTTKQWLNTLLTVATRHRALTIALHTLAVAVAAALLYVSASRMDAKRVQVEFEREADRVTNRIAENLDVYKGVVESISSFYSASEHVSRADFNEFVRSTLIHNRGIHAVAWVPKVAAADRASYEQAARKEGLTDFQFQRWKQSAVWGPDNSQWTDHYFPVYFIQPETIHEVVWGIDLGSHSVRRHALETAALTGKPFATSGIQLANTAEVQTGFLVFVPVYEKGAPIDQPDQRNNSLRGFALGVFRMSDIINDAVVSTYTHGLTLRISDGSGKKLYRSLGTGGEALTGQSRFQFSEALSFAGRTWELDIRSTPMWEQSRNASVGLPIVLVASVVALLMGLLLHLVIDRAKRVEQLVLERTAELEAANRAVRHHSERLSEAKQVLEQSNQQLEEFAYAASHDLQTPLRGISSFAIFLKEEYAESMDETANSYVARIIDSTARMRQLILGLLEYSRVESKSDGLQLVSLNDVFDDATQLLRQEIEAADAAVSRDDLPEVNGDAEQLAQVFRNLISNGLKYRSEQPVKIHVSANDYTAENSAIEKDAWSVTVADNGIGIEPRFQAQIFEIFRRLHTHQEYSGTGIGLALCRRIVQRHGGDISVDSEEGQGSRFTFSIPKLRTQHTHETDAANAKSCCPPPLRYRKKSSSVIGAKRRRLSK